MFRYKITYETFLTNLTLNCSQNLFTIALFKETLFRNITISSNSSEKFLISNVQGISNCDNFDHISSFKLLF